MICFSGAIICRAPIQKCQLCNSIVPNLYKPCTNPGFEIIPRWLHGCCNLLTTLQPRDNLVTTLCHGASKLGRLLLPSHGIVTSLTFLYGMARFLLNVQKYIDLVYQTVFLAWGEDRLGMRLKYNHIVKVPRSR